MAFSDSNELCIVDDPNTLALCLCDKCSIDIFARDAERRVPVLLAVSERHNSKGLCRVSGEEGQGCGAGPRRENLGSDGETGEDAKCIGSEVDSASYCTWSG